MSEKAVSGTMLILLLIGMLILTFNIQPVRANGTIYIRTDGSIDPPAANITTIDNVTYTFTDNIYDEIVVEKSNIVIDGNGYALQGTGPGTGIYLSGRSNVTIKNTEIKSFLRGIWLDGASNNTISRNNITNNNYYGIWFYESSNNNTISRNNITANTIYGVYLISSSGNSISGNIIANNLYGISLECSSGNILRGNSIAKNERNFGVSGRSWRPLEFENDVDASNTVDGKPIYYWIDKRDMAVPLDAGYVALVNCTNITVENLNLTNNFQGVVLVCTINSTITKNNITANNECGIELYWSSNNSISSNNITNDHHGIFGRSSNYNTISGNIITNNTYGIGLISSSNNKFYHNNFIDNTRQQVRSTSGYVNFWDDGYCSGGNYWSDYTDVDLYSGPYQNETGSDGIGDTPYVINANNQDNYPLMNPYGVSVLGDLDGDFDVDEEDIWHFCEAFTNYYKTGEKDLLCDFDDDCDIDADDLWAFCGAFIEYYKAK